MRNFFNKIRKGLANKLYELFKGKVDEETLEKLEQIFYEADLGPALAAELTEKTRKIFRQDPQTSVETVISKIQQELAALLSVQSSTLKEGRPSVMLIVGINGSGKTTSIAKLAKYYQDRGKKVLVAACDTFRAAATEQLEIWSKRVGFTLVKGRQGADPAAVAFDALSAAKARSYDLLLVDTAGRLHVKNDLMLELQKIRNVLQKLDPEAPHETLLVLDASIGQNAILQAKNFHSFTPLTGLILTKLDGTTKGGTVAAIQRECALAVKFTGTGEGAEDLDPFDADLFARELLTR